MDVIERYIPPREKYDSKWTNASFLSVDIRNKTHRISKYRGGFMDFFGWKDNYSVGIKRIDEQHKKLVGYLNELYGSMKAGKGKVTLGAVLKSLVEYTQTHFVTEESLMALYNFPDLEEHKKKHGKMAEHVLKLNQKFVSGEISSPIQITNFLKDWLAKHILETDKMYGPFLNDKGVR